ncbi:uncharacterized protein LOC134715464 isoform X2 [Mytilus trossulus]
MSTKRPRRKKNVNDSINPPKPDEEDVLRDTLYTQGLDMESVLGSTGNFELPESLQNLQMKQTQTAGQGAYEAGSNHAGRSKEELAELMKKLGVGEGVRNPIGSREDDSFAGETGQGGGLRASGSGQGGIDGMQGGFSGFENMGIQSSSGGQQEQREMSQEEKMMFKGLENLGEKDKEAALLAMGGPELLQQYHQSIGPTMQQMRMVPGSGMMMGSGRGGMMGSGVSGLNESGNISVGGMLQNEQRKVPGGGGMLGGRGMSSNQQNRRRQGHGNDTPHGRMGGRGIPGMNGGGIPGMNVGGVPGMNGGGIPGMNGGGIPGMGLGGIPGMGGGNGEMNQENVMQMLQQFQMLESMSAKDKEEALMAMGGQEYVQMYSEKIAPLMQQMGMGQGGSLNSLAGGGSSGQGAGGIGQGGGGMFGPGNSGLSGMLGGGGIGGGSNTGDLFGQGGQGNLGGLFGSGGRGRAQLGSMGPRHRQIDAKTLEGLQNLSEEDKKAALQAMGTDPDILQQSNLGPSTHGETFEAPQPRYKNYEPPPEPYEPTGPGMYQFHRRQPLQLPIHSGGAESRGKMDCMMPMSRRKRRFGERVIVRTHGSSIDLEGYYKHLIDKWSKDAVECSDPLCTGPSTILLLDVSESMRGEPIRQAVEAALGFIDGLEKNKTDYGLEENLGLIVFHGDTFDVTHLTSEYSKIRNVISNLEDVGGSSPLIMTLAVIQGMAARAKVVKIKGHEILTRAIIFSDCIVTPPGFDATQEEYVRERVQKSVDANFFESSQDLTHDYHVRLFAVPTGENTREWFCNRIAHDGFGENVSPEDTRWLCRNYICERILAECKVKVTPLNPDDSEDEPDEDHIKEVAESMYSDVNEDDIEFVVKRFKEKLQRPALTKRQRREKRLQDQIDRAEAIERGENPPPLPEDPKKKNKANKTGRKSLEELLGIDSDDDDDEEEDDEETDLLFRLPGLLGDEEDAENDPLTKQKIEELLEYYGGGPPKIDNLPNMPETGTKVIKGPDWMWQKNDIPDKIEGTVISYDQEDLGWIKVRWDSVPGSNEPGKEEDYRYGVDYEFDVMPAKGGMEAVDWPEGKKRKIVEPIWLQELNREKEELAELRARIEAEKEKEQKLKDEKEKKKEKKEQKDKDRKSQHSTETSTTQTSDDNNWSDLSSMASEVTKEEQICFVWQYQENDGTWRTYDTDTQAKLEQTFIKRNGKGTVVIDFEDHNERVVFEKMEQRRIDKHHRRQVRRIEADAERLKELQDMFSS